MKKIGPQTIQSMVTKLGEAAKALGGQKSELGGAVKKIADTLGSIGRG
jgi:hypothetical protein